MAAEQVLSLLDSYWFETTILTNSKTPSKFHPKLDPIISHTNNVEEEVLPPDTKFLPNPTLEIRSYSDQTLDSTACVFCDSPSPDSALIISPKLRTIPSGREIREFTKGAIGNNHEKEEDVINTKRRKPRHSHGRSRLRRSKTRSLTELEFKELKGFMDLGFVFSEEDKDSKLVSLIPGLQRLGRREEDNDDAVAGQGGGDEEEQQNIDDDGTVVSGKPYLSEAWGVLDQRWRRNPLLNWRVPERGSEIDMKHNLRFWAHTVASSVR